MHKISFLSYLYCNCRTHRSWFSVNKKKDQLPWHEITGSTWYDAKTIPNVPGKTCTLRSLLQERTSTQTDFRQKLFESQRSEWPLLSNYSVSIQIKDVKIISVHKKKEFSHWSGVILKAQTVLSLDSNVRQSGRGRSEDMLTSFKEIISWSTSPGPDFHFRFSSRGAEKCEAAYILQSVAGDNAYPVTT